VEYEKAKFSTQSEIGIYNFQNVITSELIGWDSIQNSFAPSTWRIFLVMDFLKAESWDNLNGIDLGVIMGPAFELKKIWSSLSYTGRFMPGMNQTVPLRVLCSIVLNICLKSIINYNKAEIDKNEYFTTFFCEKWLVRED